VKVGTRAVARAALLALGCAPSPEGIRLTVESRLDGVAYRFDVAPGADVGAIRTRYEGADEVRLEDGALLVRAGSHVLREQGLRCFQDLEGKRLDVPCRYEVSRARDGAFEVAFAVEPYDRTRALVIDPEIGWSSYLGGSGTGNGDIGYGIAVDSAGNVYVAGDTCSSDFPTPGGFDTTIGGSCDAFVTKVSTAGSVVSWSSYLGGEDPDEGYGVAVDSSGNVYVTGYTASSDFPTPGGFDTMLGGSFTSDAFVTKVDAAGSSLVWSSYLGGGDYDYGEGVALDSAGNVYVTGHTSSSDFPTPGGFDTVHGGGLADDAFVTKVDAAGSSLAWSSYLGGGNDDYGRSVAVDSAGNAYVTGDTYSSDFPTTGGFDSTYGGSIDAFVAKVDAAGSSLAWSSYLGGGNHDYGRSVAVDSAGNAYVAGYTYSSDFPTSGGFDTTLMGSIDAFVTKVNAAGSSLAWSSYVGGADRDYGYGVALDSAGNTYLTGATLSLDFPTTGGFDATFGGGFDAFVAKVDAAGSSLVWSSYLGGANDDFGRKIAVDSAGNVYVAGETYSSDFPAIGGFDTTLAGTQDAFVTKVVFCGNGQCDGTENDCTCPGECDTVCGDSCCSGSETACGCPQDCGAVCGDGCCTGAESCDICVIDCGTCPDSGPEPQAEPPPDGLALAPDAGPDTATEPGADAGARASAPSGCACDLGHRERRGVPLTVVVSLLVLARVRRRRG
jgi:beta-propeller repeat-containing protein